ncbi:plasmid replication initiator TrfA [Salinarimonas sp.]|uniref:plasmid replication initiator TrfA n=1 Tax=Salinarimonas sp. TaxID=2766526 RepID=UPI00391C4999
MSKQTNQANSSTTIANVQDASLRRRLASLEKTISATDAAKAAPTAPTNDNTPAPAMLPLWPEAVRAVPNGVLRTALFGAIAKGKRRYLDDEELAAVDGVSVRYTGQRLDQGDLDVWESILHLVRTQALGKECRVTSYALLRLMGKTDTGKNRAVLAKRITRLRASAIVLKTARYTYIGGLVDEGRKDEKTQEWRIKINPNLAALFGRDQYTQLDWTIRKALEGKPLAQWLHGFYSSHANPFPVREDTLLRLAGSEDTATGSSRQTLRKALKDVASAAAASGQAFRFEIVGGLVHVDKSHK